MDWNAMAGPWLRMEAQTDAAHRPVLDGLLARAQLQPGQVVLDIGPGAGVSLVAAARAVGPSGKVTGIEIAPPMADRARERAPDQVEVVTADAQYLDPGAGPFDAAISLFGVMFFGDSLAAMRRIRAAMKPGARFCFACWGERAANPWFSIPGEVAEAVFGPAPEAEPDAPGPMRFADADALAGLMAKAGWTATVDCVDLHLTPLGTARDVAGMMSHVGAAAYRMRIAKEGGLLTDAQKSAVRAGLERAFAALEAEGQIKVPARINYVTARA